MLLALNSSEAKTGAQGHPLIVCDFEMWNDMQFRYEVLKYFMSSRVGKYNEA